MVYIYTRKREAPDDIFSLTGMQQQALKKIPTRLPVRNQLLTPETLSLPPLVAIGLVVKLRGIQG